MEISQKGSILYTACALAGLLLAYHNTTSCMQGSFARAGRMLGSSLRPRARLLARCLRSRAGSDVMEFGTIVSISEDIEASIDAACGKQRAR